MRLWVSTRRKHSGSRAASDRACQPHDVGGAGGRVGGGGGGTTRTSSRSPNRVFNPLVSKPSQTSILQQSTLASSILLPHIRTRSNVVGAPSVKLKFTSAPEKSHPSTLVPRVNRQGP